MDNFANACLDSNIDFLQNIDSDFDRYRSFSQADICPSLSSSFLTIDTTQMSFDDSRRNSHVYGTQSLPSPEDYTTSAGSVTSPITPLGLSATSVLYSSEAWAKASPHDVWHRHGSDADSLWLASEESAMGNCLVNDLSQSYSSSTAHPEYFPLIHRPKSTSDPSLAREIFQNPGSHHTIRDFESVVPWPTASLLSHSQTVEPSRTLQAMLPSSPLAKFEPITPLRHHHESSVLYSSSPLSGASSSILASQWEIDESKCFSPHDVSAYQEHGICSQSLCSSPSVEDNKHSDGSSRKPFPRKSGVDCEAVIPQNEFACSVPGCIDKETGKPKRFKRQEHKKRHEKTVHQKVDMFVCWVCSRPFTRRDNLKSHQFKTHGRKSNNQRNSYVATLDASSRYFDKDWEGRLNADGLPVGHPSHPGIH